MSMDLVVQIEPAVEKELSKIHPRFSAKAKVWADAMQSDGLVRTQVRFGDHHLGPRNGMKRYNQFATRLNHRYRLIYEVLRQGTQIIVHGFDLDKHNKETY